MSFKRPVLWWLSHGELRMPLHDAVGINCKKGATTENQIQIQIDTIYLERKFT